MPSRMPGGGDFEGPISASKVTQDTGHRFVTDSEKSEWSDKQDKLTSGTNIKSINGCSLLGPGNLSIAKSADLVKYVLYITNSRTNNWAPTLQWHYSHDGKLPTVVRNSNGSFTVTLPTSMDSPYYYGVLGTAEHSEGLRMVTILSKTANSFTYAFYNNQGIQAAEAVILQVLQKI